MKGMLFMYHSVQRVLSGIFYFYKKEVLFLLHRITWVRKLKQASEHYIETEGIRRQRAYRGMLKRIELRYVTCLSFCKRLTGLHFNQSLHSVFCLLSISNGLCYSTWNNSSKNVCRKVAWVRCSVIVIACHWDKRFSRAHFPEYNLSLEKVIIGKLSFRRVVLGLDLILKLFGVQSSY